MGDLNSVLARIVALRTSIVDDGMKHGIPFHLKDLHTLAERLESEGSSFVKVTLPQLGKALDIGLVTGHFLCPANFKRIRGTCLPIFCGRVFQRIFKGEDGTLLVSPDPCSIYFLRQFLLLDSKLISEPTALQKKEAIDGFRERQRILGKTKVMRDHPVLVRAKLLLTRTLKDLDLSNITPRHGPGGVAEGLDRIERWGMTSWPRRAERWYPFHVYGSQSFLSIVASGPPSMVSNSHTKCSLVPKDYKGPRLISAESTATQYLQQGQMNAIMLYIDRHKLLSRSIKLRDQTHSQQMCKNAYANGYGTIDLSNASDTVSAALVWYLLSGLPRLRSQLFCTRSQSMKIDHELVRLTAFSPMGSAVCFPVETLVFWSITLAATRFVQHSWMDSTIPSESATASEISVFGDDIIAPGYAISTILGTLESVGCSVNKSKTCYATPFRESCGSEWINDIDVTITRNRRYDYEATRKFVNYPVLLDLQRKFFLQGLGTTAALLSQWAREISPIVTIEFWKCGPRIVQSRNGIGTRCSDPRRSLYEAWVQPARSGNTYRYGFGFEGCATAFPSGLDIFVRGSTAFDSMVCALGWYTSLDCGVPTRYNQNYQRTECRLPSLFQRTRQWDTYSFNPDNSGGLTTPDCRRNRSVLGKARLTLLGSGYPRLLARIVGDTVERIAIRNVMLKMAWSELPILTALAVSNG